MPRKLIRFARDAEGTFFWFASMGLGRRRFSITVMNEELVTTLRLLIGTWTLESWSERKPDGKVEYPLGEDAIGQIFYSEDGHVAAQLIRRTQDLFVSKDWRDASQVEAARAWKEYFGYFGTYSIDMSKRAVIHHIQGSWFPNLLGTDQIRRFRFEASKLVLDAETDWGQVRIVWKRATENHWIKSVFP
jgi:hypothetical protein